MLVAAEAATGAETAGGGPPANSTVKVDPLLIPAGTTIAFKRPSGACT